MFLRVLIDELYGEWTLFVASSLFGARWIYQGARDSVPRDLMGEYKYAGPTFFFALGVVLQIPLLLRLMLYRWSGGH